MKVGDVVRGTLYDSLLEEYRLDGMTMLWTMKDGGEISIENMKDSHIQNCINMLKRKDQSEIRRAWIDIFEDVKLKRRFLKLNKIKNKILNNDII